jgi:hypothetical protein
MRQSVLLMVLPSDAVLFIVIYAREWVADVFRAARDHPLLKKNVFAHDHLGRRVHHGATFLYLIGCVRVSFSTMDANLPQVDASDTEPRTHPIIPAAVAVVQSLNLPPGAPWAQVAEMLATRTRVGVDGRSLALLIERLICHGEL